MDSTEIAFWSTTVNAAVVVGIALVLEARYLVHRYRRDQEYRSYLRLIAVLYTIVLGLLGSTITVGIGALGAGEAASWQSDLAGGSAQ